MAAPEQVTVIEPKSAQNSLEQAVEPKKQSGCEIASHYDWDYRIAYAVCMAESNGNPNAANLNDKHNGCTGSYGLMQIACIHTGKVAEYNSERNMEKAYEIYTRSGWKPWGAYTSGAYTKYL